MAPAPSVAVLGAGILGSSVALFLARRGALVTLFDAKDRPFEGASRWNEGNIHLGYIYAADQTGSTARQLLPGALTFRSLAERLIGRSLQSATTRKTTLSCYIGSRWSAPRKPRSISIASRPWRESILAPATISVI